jgi:ArsR family transcriptional regulator
MRELAEVFKALAEETRVQIIAMLLLRGELCVCDVEGALGITQSKSSRHLRYLLHAGLVENRRQGVWMHYRIPKKQKTAQKVLLRAVRNMLSDDDVSELKSDLDKWFEQKSRCAPN